MHVRILPGEEEFCPGAEADGVFGGGKAGAAAGAAEWLQFELGNASDDARMNGVRGTTGVEVFIQGKGPHVLGGDGDVASAS